MAARKTSSETIDVDVSWMESKASFCGCDVSMSPLAGVDGNEATSFEQSCLATLSVGLSGVEACLLNHECCKDSVGQRCRGAWVDMCTPSCFGQGVPSGDVTAIGGARCE